MAATVCPKCDFQFQNDAQHRGSTVFCPSCKGSFQTESLPPEQPKRKEKAKPKKVKDADDGIPIRANRGGIPAFGGWGSNWSSPAVTHQFIEVRLAPGMGIG